MVSVEGDAQTVELPDRSADGVFSRFGVMAFADPAAAFANFHQVGKILREAPGLRAAAEPRPWAALAEREARGSVALRAAIWVVAAGA
ncbi:methyltransferase domain-containing protein [Phenylobacterium sp.]|uniref:methyltransferase domain-containing protein n=1 Tax=Phenylobacterium sp. TaxID=1871053 RepID=UPI0025F96F25|nr:methyltransferase domain-containing protein [Phenylobacterium sp.]